MQGLRKLSLITILVVVFGLMTAGSIAAQDTVFTAIDLTTVSISSGTEIDSDEMAPVSGSQGVEPSPFIVWRNNTLNIYFAWIMTLSSETGAQLGQRALINFSEYEVPAAMMWSKHFLAIPGRGVEPSPFIVFRNYSIRYYSVAYAPDGSPTIGIAHNYSPSINPAVYGYPTCMTELPGTAFTDGYPRLCIGTDNGYIILLIDTFVAGIQVDRTLRAAMVPVADLEPIPQYDYISLGALSGGIIYGYMFNGLPAKSGDNLNEPVYMLEDLRAEYATDFDVLGVQDEALPSPGIEVMLVMANGTEELALASIGSEQTGVMPLDPAIELHNDAVQAVVSGSLLMLMADGSGVRYDPSYTEAGSSGCDIDITDGENDDCSVICGDANGDGQVNVGDVVFIIAYVFKDGPAPDPVCAGNANSDADTNVADAVYLIGYIFKGGAPPPPDCCL